MDIDTLLKIDFYIETTTILYFWSYLSIFCHEMGHFIFCKLVGFYPYYLRVGTGFKILKVHLFNTLFELGIIPSGGLTAFSRNPWDISDLKNKYILISIGGPLANLLLLVLLIYRYEIDRNPILVILMVFEVKVLLNNLTSMGSDGDSLTSAIALKYEEYLQSIFEAYKEFILLPNHQENELPEKFFNIVI